MAPKMAVPGVGWAAYFFDPEGNAFGVMQFDRGRRMTEPAAAAGGEVPWRRDAVPGDAAFGARARPQRRRRHPARRVRRSRRRLLEAELPLPAPAVAADAGGGRGRRPGLLRHRLREAVRRALRPGAVEVPHVPARLPRSVRAEPAQGGGAPTSAAAGPRSCRSISRAPSASSTSMATAIADADRFFHDETVRFLFARAVDVAAGRAAPTPAATSSSASSSATTWRRRPTPATPTRRARAGHQRQPGDQPPARGAAPVPRSRARPPARAVGTDDEYRREAREIFGLEIEP